MSFSLSLHKLSIQFMTPPVTRFLSSPLRPPRLGLLRCIISSHQDRSYSLVRSGGLLQLRRRRQHQLKVLPYQTVQNEKRASSRHLDYATRFVPLPTTLSHTRSVTMATDKAVDSLSEQLARLPPLDKYPNCYPEINPVDIYRAHARILTK